MSDDALNSLAQILGLLRPMTLLMLVSGFLLLSLLVKVLRRGGDQLITRFPSRRLLVLQIVNIAGFVIYMIGTAVLFFGVLAPPRELMIAVAGGLAVAVGLSLKDIVASLVAGIILLFDRPFNVGDRVQFRDNYGEITSIGLRAVRMQTLDDNTVTIPNSVFVTDVASSGNFGELTMMVTVSMFLQPDTDLQAAQDIAYETVVTSRYAYVRRPVSIVFKQIFSGGCVATEMTVKAYVVDVKYEKAFASSILLQCSRAFAEHGIQWAGAAVAGAGLRATAGRDELLATD
ncbi:MAG: mechanosensitive ion channel [Gammaproteobacteria bacterium]|nr:mechanosensitive ion channel [Gammaproteobacteria bacterium]